jgi:REP element-mobilizing transposase RayT
MGSYSQLTYHIVFGTKFRRNSICAETANQFYEYIGGTIRSQNGHLFQIGGVEDHLHLLVSLPSTITVSDAVRVIKANSSKWVNENRDSRDKRNATDKFEWQIGFGAFTVSYSQIEVVRRYIQNQKEHHRTKTFEEEYIELLDRHNISFKKEHLFEAEHAG